MSNLKSAHAAARKARRKLVLETALNLAKSKRTKAAKLVKERLRAL
jgi:hypothetical protein